MDAHEFHGQAALVTGAGSGLGACVATRLAAAGAIVAVADIDCPAAESVVNVIASAGGRALALKVDVTDADAVQAAVAATVQQLGPLHLAVNNAGISLPRMPTGEYPVSDWNRVLRVNLGGVFHCMRHELPAMQAAGGGAIVNIASIMGLAAQAGVSAYAASKHGVIGLTKAAALEYAEQGIRINAVAPGYIDTPLLASRPAAVIDDIRAMHPMKRMADPDEIAELVLFLLSGRASFITGSVHLADGGYMAR